MDKLDSQNSIVLFKPLGEVAEIKTGQSVSKQKISANPGIYPVINSGREPLGYINDWNTDNDPIGITTRGAGVGSITWQEGKYFRGNLNYSVTIKDELEIETRFLYHLLLEMQEEIHALCTFDGIPALNAGSLRTLVIPIPPISLQHEIVKMLDYFTELSTELTAELTARKQQYTYYKQLFLFDEPKDPREKIDIVFLNKTISESVKKINSLQSEIDQLINLFDGSPQLDELLRDIEFEWLSLGEIASFRRGSFPQPYGNSEWYDGEGAMPFVQVVDVGTDLQLVKDTKKKISKLAQPKSVFVPKGTVIVTLQGSIGRVAITQYDSYVDRTLAIFEGFEIELNKKYFAYQLEEIFKKEKETARGNIIKTITKEDFKSFPIPIPCPDNPKKSLEFQNEVVRKLDTFTKLSAELSAELSAREKQYEHYRDILLTFPKENLEE